MAAGSFAKSIVKFLHGDHSFDVRIIALNITLLRNINLYDAMQEAIVENESISNV